MKQLILASASPRRKALLEKAGLSFIVAVSNFEEYKDTAKKPEDLVQELSFGKAADVAKRHANAIILAADTIVFLNGEYLGKPKNREDAKEMLIKQSGKKQKVVTGFTIWDTDSGNYLSKAVVSFVWLRPLDDQQIDRYLDKNTYLDKAGSYAIQEVGDIFIEKIEGDYDNIVGLPVKEVLKELKAFS